MAKAKAQTVFVAAIAATGDALRCLVHSRLRSAAFRDRREVYRRSIQLLAAYQLHTA